LRDANQNALSDFEIFFGNYSAPDAPSDNRHPCTPKKA
jgi:hypothetical protein